MDENLEKVLKEQIRFLSRKSRVKGKFNANFVIYLISTNLNN